MNGKTLLLQALQSQPVPRLPWVPFVGVHGGSLIGVDAQEYLQSTDLLVAGLKSAVARYRPDGIPVVFDLQLEAEILGCDLLWAKETPPSVASHPLGEDYKIAELPEFNAEAGRLPGVLDAVRRCKSEFGEDTALYGLLTGPLTLALHLRGNDVLLDMFDELDEVPQLFDYCADIAIKMVDFYLDAGVDIIAVVDPLISLIGPDHFTDFVAPPLNKIFDHIRARGALSSLFVCGDATSNLEPMCQTTCDNISVDENVDMTTLAKIARAAGKSFGGNLQLTVVLLLGDNDDARRDVVRCLDQVGPGDGYILAPGCDLPYAIPPSNLETIATMVHDPYQIEVARRLPPKDNHDSFDDILIPNYSQENAVIVDVVTLDSAGCAPCAYMVKAARAAGEIFGQPVEIREHKITGRDGLGYMVKLGVSAIPSICVDGKEHFASIIPERAVLVNCYAKAANAKAS